MSERYPDDEITKPDSRDFAIGTHTDLHHLVGMLMAESQNHRKRIEVLEALALRSKGALDSIPPSDKSRYVKIISTTFKWTILVIAGLISALKELGYLSP